MIPEFDTTLIASLLGLCSTYAYSAIWSAKFEDSSIHAFVQVFLNIRTMNFFLIHQPFPQVRAVDLGFLIVAILKNMPETVLRNVAK